jgi:urocanate hydratase
MRADGAKTHLPEIDFADPSSPSLIVESFLCYCSLIAAADYSAPLNSQSEPNLGGKLLYAGELGFRSRAVVIAGNVAGCATLAVAEDPKIQKEAMRDGVVDFIVTSLDEALRILKNEIRKQTTVAVCVGAPATGVEREMVERGVQPALAFAGVQADEHGMPQTGHGWREIPRIDPDPALAFLSWQVAQSPARWIAKLDAIALDCLASDGSARRWIRLAPRYSGREFQAQRALYCDPDAAQRITDRFAQAVQSGEIGTEISAKLVIRGETQAFRMSPVANA